MQDYLRSPTTTPFDITTVPIDAIEPVKQPQQQQQQQQTKGGVVERTAAVAEGGADTYSAQLAQVAVFPRCVGCLSNIPCRSRNSLHLDDFSNLLNLWNLQNQKQNMLLIA